MYGPLNKLCGFECRRVNLKFLRPFFVANCDDLLHIIVRYTWLCSSRGILKTNSGRERVKCKIFCPRGLRNRVARPQTTSAKKATHFWLPLYYSGAEKKWTPLTGTPWNVAASKKSQRGWRAAERKLRAGGNSKHNFQIGCGRKQPFGVSAVHGPPDLQISCSQLEIGKIYASLPHRTTS